MEQGCLLEGSAWGRSSVTVAEPAGLGSPHLPAFGDEGYPSSAGQGEAIPPAPAPAPAAHARGRVDLAAAEKSPPSNFAEERI